MKRLITFAITLAAGGILAPRAHAQAVPTVVTYAGELTDNAGQPISASVDLTFRLYQGADPGTFPTPIWSEVHAAVQVDQGRFEVYLGNITPLTDVDLAGVERWLGISVDGNAEMTPRLQLLSVPYALRTEDSNTLGGIDATGFVQVGDSIPANTVQGAVDQCVDAETLDGLDSTDFSQGPHTPAPIQPDIEALGFFTGPHTPAPTQADIQALGFETGPHTDQTAIEAMGFVVGPHATWATLAGIPGDFSDGVDDVGEPVDYFFEATEAPVHASSIAGWTTAFTVNMRVPSTAHYVSGIEVQGEFWGANNTAGPPLYGITISGATLGSVYITAGGQRQEGIAATRYAWPFASVLDTESALFEVWTSSDSYKSMHFHIPLPPSIVIGDGDYDVSIRLNPANEAQAAVRNATIRLYSRRAATQIF